MGNLRCLGADRKPLAALQMKIFSHIASRRIRHTIGVVVEVKKEILAIISPFPDNLTGVQPI
jgi:hypothetical protein